MPKPTDVCLLLAAIVCLLLLSHAADAQKPRVTIKVDTDQFEVIDGVKNYLRSFKLYTIINGRQYFIDHPSRMMVSLPEPIVDPSGRFIFYATNTGCGFENEGMTIFVSDVYGKRKVPILGRCWYLRPARFLRGGGKNYLLITGESESPRKDFWLYDIDAARIIVHAEGALRNQGNGLFSYGNYDDEDNFKPLGTIPLKTIISGGPPLKRLPRHPTHGRTQTRNVRMYESESCYGDNETVRKKIAAAGTTVLIIAECEDGGYEILYNGVRVLSPQHFSEVTM